MPKESESLVLSDIADIDRYLFIFVMQNPPEMKGKLKSAIQKYSQKYEK